MEQAVRDLKDDLKSFGYQSQSRFNTVVAISHAKKDVDMFTLLQDGTWRYSTLDQSIYKAHRYSKSLGIVRKASMTTGEVLNLMHKMMVRIKRVVNTKTLGEGED